MFSLIRAHLRFFNVDRDLRTVLIASCAPVVIGAVPMDVATQSVTLQAPSGEGAGDHTLDVLAAGAVLPPNPGELLESRAMDVVLERARSAYDLVVIDTPPLTSVSDACPLLTKVDGVVIVGRIGRSRREDAEQLHQVLAGSGVPLLGVIANEAKSGGPVPYPGSGNSSPAASVSVAFSSSEELAPTAGA